MKKEIPQILHLITNKFILIVPGLKDITSLYIITPFGVGGNFLMLPYSTQKIGLRDQDFQDKLTL